MKGNREQRRKILQRQHKPGPNEAKPALKTRRLKLDAYWESVITVGQKAKTQGS